VTALRDRTTTRPSLSLEHHVDLRRNALNLVRLVLATTVIVWHSYVVTGNPITNTGFVQFLADLPVDGFFAISGFLLCASWTRRPHLGSYARNRILRIVPAYWTSLLLTAFVAAPVGLAMQSRDVGAVFRGVHSSWQYVLHNAALQVRFYDISSTPVDVPYPRVWNGSAWTLVWEAYAYLGLAVAAVIGLLRHRAAMVAITVLAWAVMTADDYDLIRHNFYLGRGSRLGFMFLCGVLLYQYRDRISARPWLVAVMTALLIGSAALRDYRVVGGLAVAYLVVWVGGAVRNRRWQLHSVDISYGMYIYAFPVQQLLVIAGLVSLPPLAFAVVATAATVPVALASWFVVERPALRLKSARLPRVGRGRQRVR
jgi:peptidoglycan/LPS O-acetylase OafA/YrhL